LQSHLQESKKLAEKESLSMDYSSVNLKYKILELYPEVIHYGIDLYLTYDPESNRYEVKLTLPTPVSTVFLGKKEADACMVGEKSDHLEKCIEKFVAAIRLVRNY
jgi:hypothetical protein